MQCQACGAEVRSGDRFCNQCGSPLSASCAQCGANLEPNATFCGYCGARVGAAGPVPRVAAPPPGAVAPAFRYKGVWPRFFALFLDSLLLLLVFYFVMFSLDLTRAQSLVRNYLLDLYYQDLLPEDLYDSIPQVASAVVALVAATAYSLLSFLYFVLGEGIFGWTLGKLVLGIKVVSKDGRAPGIGRAFLRNLLRIIDSLPLFYLLGIILIATSPSKQRLGDRAAGTYVVAR